jgi:hypothetical protein
VNQQKDNAEAEWARVLQSLSKADEWPQDTVNVVDTVFDTNLEQFEPRTLVSTYRAVCTQPQLGPKYGPRFLARLQLVASKLDADEVGMVLQTVLEAWASKAVSKDTIEQISEIYVDRLMRLYEKEPNALKRVTLVRLLDFLGTTESTDKEAIVFAVKALRRSVRHIEGRQAANALQALAKIPWEYDRNILRELLGIVESDANAAACAHAVCAAASIPMLYTSTMERLFIKIMFNRDVFINNAELRAELQKAALTYKERLPERVYHAFIRKQPTRWRDFAW